MCTDQISPFVFPIVSHHQWQQLESNPVTKLLFRQCGFIPVQMAANKAGEANDYDVNSFKKMLKSVKQAFNEGFDIGILPEGQLNPTPELGLRPCFPGAFTLAKLSKRPIHMMALNGCHRLWHPRDDIGMTVTGRTIKARVYPNGRRYSSSDEFLETFQAVVGHFGTKGKDMPAQELQRWLEGTEYKNRSA
jgi:1-acyl-sn-glycerol-3-phosphate acyltransferase